MVWYAFECRSWCDRCLQVPKASKHEKAASDGGFFHCRESTVGGAALFRAEGYEGVVRWRRAASRTEMRGFGRGSVPQVARARPNPGKALRADVLTARLKSGPDTKQSGGWDRVVVSHICQDRGEPFDSLRSLRPGCGAPGSSRPY
jgi:hypothetical protein